MNKLKDVKPFTILQIINCLLLIFLTIMVIKWENSLKEYQRPYFKDGVICVYNDKWECQQQEMPTPERGDGVDTAPANG